MPDDAPSSPKRSGSSGSSSRSGGSRSGGSSRSDGSARSGGSGGSGGSFRSGKTGGTGRTGGRTGSDPAKGAPRARSTGSSRHATAGTSGTRRESERREPRSGSDRDHSSERRFVERGPAGERRRDAEAPPAKRKPWSAEGELPRWIQDEIGRVTAKQRVAPVTELLQSAAKNFASGKYGKALFDAEQAKELAPRVATIREVLGLSAYRIGRWDVALRELRTFRRFTGETTHMPVEMDVLRALDRPDDVAETWASFRKLGGDRATEHEARVVFGSFLLDIGDDRRAWEITNPKRMGPNPEESELRVWFVAARAASRLGDLVTARRLYEAIQDADPGFPGLDELDRTTAGR